MNVVEVPSLPAETEPDATASAGQSAPPVPPASEGNAAAGTRRASLAEFMLGSALLLTDEVSERLIVEETIITTPRTPESVFRPVSEWEELFAGNERVQRASFLTVGILRDAGETARGGLAFVDVLTDSAGRAVSRLAGPAWRSAPLAPVRRLSHRLQRAGENQIADWIAKGQRESYRSRALAETSISSFVTESVVDLSRNAQVQVMVQQVVTSPDVQQIIEQVVARQSTSILGTIIDEVRQRLITLDILLERFCRRLLRLKPREELPRPSFREAYVARRQPLYVGRDFNASLGGDYAGFVTRAVAFVIDLAILGIAYTLATTFINGTLTLFRLDTFILNVMARNPNLEALTTVAIAALAFLILLGYGVLSWSLTGETVGDSLAGVRVVSADGSRVTMTRSIVRFVGCFVAALPLFLGFFWVFVDNRRQGWHDKLANTRVVYDWPALPDEVFLQAQLGLADRGGSEASGW